MNNVIYGKFRRRRGHANAPRDPDFVSMIIYAKDDSGEDLSWREIARIVASMFVDCHLSAMGAWYHYRRWRAWYYLDHLGAQMPE